MPKKNRLTWNYDAYRRMRQDQGLVDQAKEEAQKIADEASEGGRVKGYVVTELELEDPRGAVSVMATGHAARHDRKNLSLLKAAKKVADENG